MIEKTKLLFIARNYPPLTGGMERLNYQASLAFCGSYTVSMCGPTGAKEYLQGGGSCEEVPATPLSKYLLSCQWRAFHMARNIRPSIVYSGSGVTAPSALMAARSVGASCVCFLHGLDIIADHPIYRHVFLPAIRKFDRVLVNSAHTRELAKQAGVDLMKIDIVFPGVKLPEWQDRVSARHRFREQFGLSDRPILLSVGRLTRRKGLKEFIRHALPGIRHQVPDVLLVIVGGEAFQSLTHKHGVRDEILLAIQEMSLERNVIMLGTLSDSCLSEAYFSADAMVFPVLELPSDVEGFGMVAVEAAAHGLPTVAFAVGGVPDAVENNKSGFLVPAGDMSEMIVKTVSILRGIKGEWSVNCRKHAERFTWDVFGRNLTACVGLLPIHR